MKKALNLLTAVGMLAATGLAATTPAQAEYPEKPVSFIVPWPPGDLEDVLTRIIADEFQATYGVPAAVVNKPGGGGGPFPGAVSVATAPADGYTIGSFVVDVPVSGPVIGIPELSPNPFEPIGGFMTYPFVIVAKGDAPYSNWAEFSEYAKKNEVTLGHFGAPLPPTRITLAAAKKSGFDFGSDAAFDELTCNTLASGDADVINTTIQLVLPCLKDVKVLASIGEERISLTPDVPTVAELFPELNVSLWNGLYVRKGTPDDVREKIATVAQKALKSEKAQKLIKETGVLIYWNNPEETNKVLEKHTGILANIDKLLDE